MLRSTTKIAMPFTKLPWNLDWRFLVLIMAPVSLLFLMFLSSFPISTTLTNFSTFYSVSHFMNIRFPFGTTATAAIDSDSYPPPPSKEELVRSRMAVCLVGGARRFELTGPSIIEMILKQYPNSDLFLHSPFDSNTYKLSLLNSAPKIAAVRIFEPQPLPENDSYVRVLTSMNSPNGIQGLLQYFNLVEGCIKMIKSYQEKNNFTYDWVVRTRVDGYWNKPLGPANFVRGKYLVPVGSSYGGLNDRFGVGDLETSTVALSRLSLVPKLDSAGFNSLNSESAFKAQLTTQKVGFLTKLLPFCVVSDRRYDFPPSRYGVPVAAISSPGPLSGAKCRPCRPVCVGKCVESVMGSLDKDWSWTHWAHGSLELCDARDKWEDGWEKIFDSVAGKKLAGERKRVRSMDLEDCVENFLKFKKRTADWDAPSIAQICKLGLGLS
ncbi:hypothetical protein PIB30_004119 [Stylosanthes scabra]|uniref:DUF7796 domain-containing protein n=1 Tax=Stylosanthes scabra TaxID=79078 RepID=A0ABU6Q3E3_9FABA|nr:hypothetical protein [Stylosanthes scabra]